MTFLPVFPCRLIARPYKGMGVNIFSLDVELDIITVENDVARKAAVREKYAARARAFSEEAVS